MTDLQFPGAPGCAGARRMAGGAPMSCGAEPTQTVHHRYRYPRPHDARLLVCDEHGRGEPDPRPLTGEDRAELARRRELYTRAYRRRDDARREQRDGDGTMTS